MFTRLMATTIKTAFKAALIILAVAIIIPTIWFIWRMYQPMNRPEFHNVTYIEYMAWRKVATQDFINRWNVAHPTYKYTGIGDQMFSCWGGDEFGAVANIFISMDMVRTAYELDQDELTQYNKANRTDLPKIDSLWDISKVSKVEWDSFEYLDWANALYAPHGPVEFCRIHVPSANDFEAMKNNNQLISSTK